MTTIQQKQTMASRPSSSSTNYELLHPRVQRWIWDQGWQGLREVQILATPPVLEASHDVLITAATAAGKSEAAWLPIASRLAFDEDEATARLGVKAVYISPLKALINDQRDRLESLFTTVDLPVSRRHADVSGVERDRILRKPDGILLITPESLEAMFVNHGSRLRMIFSGLRYIVIDELHEFIGRERGAQLQSLMHRLENLLDKRIPRIALSATLGDISLATRFLRPGSGSHVHTVIPSLNEGAALRLQVKGYLQQLDSDPTAYEQICGHLFETLRSSNNLIFANSRGNVELYTDALQKQSEQEGHANGFFAHHGNLSRDMREFVEHRLQPSDLPTTAVCTSTLELGIDIGSVRAIAQIGSPGQVASLRQRVGRSGRRSNAAILRCYVMALDSATASHVEDRISLPLVETIAIVELMLERWLEPPKSGGLHLSTLIQQVLSSIAQFSGRFANELYNDLCNQGPFTAVSESQFIALLRSLGEKDILTQANDGLLLPGTTGERIINHYSFYTAFQTSEEFRIVANGRTLGTLPISSPVIQGEYLIFGGRRWQVESVDAESKIIELTHASGGKPPLFESSAIPVHGEVRRRMRNILSSDYIPGFLDKQAQTMLHNARKHFESMQLNQRHVIQDGRDVVFVPWCGDDSLTTLALMLTHRGLKASRTRMTLTIDRVSVDEVLNTMREIVVSPPHTKDLPQHIGDLRVEKHDWMLPDSLLSDAYIARELNVDEALDILIGVINRGLTDETEGINRRE